MDKLPNTEKRKPKSPVKFKISLNEEQREAKALILEKDVTLLTGQAGSGKTLLACNIALSLFFNRDIEKIIITRPAVAASDELGFLPGDIKSKMDPWLAPIYANLYTLCDKVQIDKLVEQQSIEILPLPYVRGRTFVNAIVIVDEAQNVTHSQTEMIIGRLGQNSKMIFCGDSTQIDLKNKKSSGIDFFRILVGQVSGVGYYQLKKNHRHEIVPPILQVYKEYSV